MLVGPSSSLLRDKNKFPDCFAARVRPTAVLPVTPWGTAIVQNPGGGVGGRFASWGGHRNGQYADSFPLSCHFQGGGGGGGQHKWLKMTPSSR